VVFGSNTSTIPITALSKASSRPKNFVGIHFFSPVHRMSLVEIIRGEETSDYAISRAIDFVMKIKKLPIVVEDTRAFFANRCVMRFGTEGVNMLMDGVKPALIENAARMAGMPVGPLSLQDEVSIDLAYKAMMQAKADFGDAYEENPVDEVTIDMYERGRYGRKSGNGFYVYNGKEKSLWKGLDRYAKAGVLKVQPSVEEVKDRLLYCQSVEAARTMEEGIVQDPREADLGSILGWGFPPYTGGVISYIDTVGAEKFVKRADELAEKYGKQFIVPNRLREMAEKGESYYS